MSTLTEQEILALFEEKNEAAEEALQEYLESIPLEKAYYLLNKSEQELPFKYYMLKGIIEMSAIVELFNIKEEEQYNSLKESYITAFKEDFPEVKEMKMFFFKNYILNENLNEYCNNQLNSLNYNERVKNFLKEYNNEKVCKFS